MSKERLKLVIVGDGACGKTDLLAVFREGSCSTTEYTPTVFETHTVDVLHEGKRQVELGP